jgi:hypothetical protein
MYTYFMTSASLHNVALVNCWSIAQRLDAVVCIAVMYYSFLSDYVVIVLRLHGW